jgi:hypothetical protein
VLWGGECARNDFARRTFAARHVRESVSCVWWCEACWIAGGPGREGFYTGGSPQPSHVPCRAILSDRGCRSLRRGGDQVQDAGGPAPVRRPAASRVPAGGAGSRRAGQRGPSVDARARGRRLVPARARALAAGGSSTAARLHRMRAPQPGSSLVLRGVRTQVKPRLGHSFYLTGCSSAQTIPEIRAAAIGINATRNHRRHQGGRSSPRTCSCPQKPQ